MVKKTTIEDFMGTFHIVPMETNVDSSLVTLEKCRQKILDNISYNIQMFKTAGWNRKNNIHKMLVDADTLTEQSVFTIRLGKKEIYKCNCQLSDITTKLDFLTKFYSAVSKGIIDKNILAFSETRSKKLKERKQKKNEQRKSLRQAKKDLKQQLEKEAIEHLPKS